MKKFLCFVPLLMLISYANAQSNTLENHGAQTHLLTCHDFNGGAERCMKNADELCNGNYHLVSQHKEVYPDAGDGFYMPPKHHIAVQCKQQ